jgi:hypothetical protein
MGLHETKELLHNKGNQTKEATNRMGEKPLPGIHLRKD